MRIMIGSVFAALICAFAVFPQDEEQTTDQTFITLERELSDALNKGDAATVDRILAENYTEVTAQGVLQNKADIMALVRARAAVPKAISVGPEVTTKENKLIVYGDVAISSGVRITKYQHMDY